MNAECCVESRAFEVRFSAQQTKGSVKQFLSNIYCIEFSAASLFNWKIPHVHAHALQHGHSLPHWLEVGIFCKTCGRVFVLDGLILFPSSTKSVFVPSIS